MLDPRFRTNKTLSDKKRTEGGWLKTGDEWTHKPCKGCKQVLPFSHFTLGNYQRFSIASRCKPCEFEHKRRNYLMKKTG